MIQVLLCGMKRQAGEKIVVWSDVDLAIGDQIRWNGSPWRVGSVYGTRLCLNGYEAQVREKPRDDRLDS